MECHDQRIPRRERGMQGSEIGGEEGEEAGRRGEAEKGEEAPKPVLRILEGLVPEPEVSVAPDRAG